jgi:hypothetical protein
MLRNLTELPGGPCVLVLCHPIKYVLEPSQLLPRGGGAFLAEMDGNLTAWKSDDLIEFHHGKIRGPGFEPMVLRIERFSPPTLKDAKGRELPTVRIRVVTEQEEGDVKRNLKSDENHVLAALLENPDYSQAEIARKWGWFFRTGEPAKSRVNKILRRLDNPRNSPKLLKQNRDRWELTDAGKDIARKAALQIDNDARQMAAEREPELRYE